MNLSRYFTYIAFFLCLGLSVNSSVLQAKPKKAVNAAASQSASDLADKRSKEEGKQVTLIVTNTTPIPIRVNWVDHEGKEGVSQDVIAAGATVEMGTTTAGHFFRARAIDGNTFLQEFRVKDNGGKFKISIAAQGNPAEMGLEKPIDAPADSGKSTPAQKTSSTDKTAPAKVSGQTGKVVIPAKGPTVSVAEARKHLKDNMPQKINEFMKLHNDARAEVGVSPLTWDSKLAAVAQKWADTLAAKGDDLQHSSNSPYGENLAGYLPEYGENPVHGAGMWYAEIKDYKGQKIGSADTTGHYTQMVWRGTTHVGFGIAMTKSGMVILCANYNPAGNMMGELPY